MPEARDVASGEASDAPFPGADSPPEAFAPSADVITDEADPPVNIVDKGFGPTAPPSEEGLTDEEIEALQALDESKDELEKELEGKEEPGEKPPEGEEPPPSEASGKESDVKETPKVVPYDRFKQVIEENQRLKQSDEILRWIMQNPERAAERLGMRASQTPTESKRGLDISLEEPKPSKPIDEMDETEQAKLWVEKSSYSYLKEPLEKVVKTVNELLTFKEQLEETLTKNAVDPDGKPLHPRWDELKGTMQEIKLRYPGMSDAEAYVLADRMVPQSQMMGDEMAQYDVPEEKPPTEQKKTVPPKRINPQAARAARIASFGRSPTNMTPTEPKLLSAEEAAMRAFDEIFKGEQPETP